MASQPHTHPKRGTVVPVRHNGQHLVGTLTPLERFRNYCRFDPLTGCVLWTGGTTNGRGNSAPYGAFWFEGKRWAAHRWAGVHIHGLDLAGVHGDHCCDPFRHGGAEPLPPNTLCVEHVRALTSRDNSLDRWERQRWLMVAKGYEEAPPLFAELGATAVEVPGFAPVYDPPAWLGIDGAVKASDDCPF